MAYNQTQERLITLRDWLVEVRHDDDKTLDRDPDFNLIVDAYFRLAEKHFISTKATA